MKIHYLGTCSGTEPMQGMYHTSLMIDVGGSLYWFDAGECCAYTAYTSGLEVMNVRAIFISHPHVDHTGGLANVFSLYHKLVGAFGKKFQKSESLRIFCPDLEIIEAIKKITLGGGKRGAKLPFATVESEVFDGVIYEDENIRVTALHNRHLGEDGSEGFHSYSFLIEAEGKRVVYSGDVARSAELEPLIGEGCDYLIHETGHHKVLGDNDTLSAIVAKLCHADLLVLFSDINGLYDSDPHANPDAKLLHRVEALTPEILSMAGGAGTWRGTGGMATKLSAAKIAMESGCDMVITNGARMKDLYGIVEGQDIGTRFIAAKGAN